MNFWLELILAILGLYFFTNKVLPLVIFFSRRFGKTRAAYFDKIPGPKGSYFLGSALEFRTTTRILRKLMEFHKQYGPTFTVRMGPIENVIMTSDYNFVQFLLKNKKMLVKSENYRYLEPWLGTGLLISNGEKWHRHRKLITPAFHFEILKQFMDTFNSVSNILLQKLEKYDNSIIDVYPLLSLCTLDVICETAMGAQVLAQSNENSNYVKAVKEMCRIITERGLDPLKMYPMTYFLTKDYYIQNEAVETLHSYSIDVINKRIEDMGKEVPKEKQKGTKMAFLDLLLKQGQLSLQDIREEVDTFMFEGHDTTATAISYILYCLSNHPEIQERAYKEQKELFDVDDHHATTYTDLTNMKYLELVIKETLRLYPTVPILGRYTTEDIEFGGITVPKHVNIGIFIYGIHRNPDYFPDPDRFYPERFETIDGSLPFAYIPFSAGFRNCIGQKFAMLEMKAIVSKILRNYELFTAGHELKLSAETVLKSKNGIKIGLKKR